MPKEIEKLKLTSGAKFFDEKQNHIFPREDFFLGVDVDKFNFAMRYDMDSETIFKEEIG